MDKLLDLLTEKTQDLKFSYVENVKTWAEKTYSQLQLNPLIKFYEYSEQKKALAGKDGFYSKISFGKTRAEDSALNRIVKILNLGLQNYIESQVKDAELHYETSLKKLVFRIQEKGLNFETLEILYSRVGVNIEIVLSDGSKTVKAHTIIASGEVQKPHYRYLIH